MIRTLTDSLKAEQDWLISYWLDAGGHTHVPPRSAINPGEVRAVLSGLSIIERAGGTFVFRLAGSHLREAFGRELRGECVPGSGDEAWCGSLREAIEAGTCQRGVEFGRNGIVHAWLRLPIICDVTGDRLALCLDRYPTTASITNGARQAA